MKTVSTEEFWELMCDLRFVRLSPHEGRVERNYYRVEVPPEQMPGFIPGQIARIIEEDLGPTGWPLVVDILSRAAIAISVGIVIGQAIAYCLGW